VIPPFNVVGILAIPGGRLRHAHFRPASSEKPITVFGTGEQVRSFTGGSDLGRFLTDSWDDTLESEARVFNIGNPANRTTVRGLAERVKALLNSGSKTVHADGKEVYGPMYEEAESFAKVTVLKAAFELGWEPRVGLDELLLETADYQTHEDYREARESSRVTYATV
jgi:nucleoside-diphosphate-sugar epimerase